MANQYNELFNKEQKEFILENLKGLSNKELTELINSTFGFNLTLEQVKAWKSYRHVNLGARSKPCKFPKEVTEYIFEIGNNRWRKEVTRMVNEKFKTNYSYEQISRFCKRNRILVNKDVRFKNGQTAWNKGMRGVKFGDGRTCFKKGNTPHNTLPIGTIVKSKDGYLRVKVEMPNKWEFVHRLVWKEHFGEIPKGYYIIFKDNNKENTNISNLEIVTHQEILEMNRQKLKYNDAELTEIGLLIARLKIKKANKEKE